MTTLPPALDGGQMQDRPSAKDGWIERLVGDGVPPGVQIVQPLPAQVIVHENGIYSPPKIMDAKPGEIPGEGRLVGIPAVKLASPEEVSPHGDAKDGVSDDRHQQVNRLRMEVAGKPLELRRQQDRISSVDLLRRVAPTARRTTQQGVRRLNLVQFPGSCMLPLPIRF
jgi:hypothetical protein